MRQRLIGMVLTGVVLVLAGAARADDDSELKALIGKAVAAHGGKANLTKYPASTWKAKGKVEVMGGINFTGEWRATTNKVRFSLDLSVMDMAINTTQVLNGDKGWIKVTVAGTVVMESEMTKEMTDEGAEEIYANRLMTLVAFAADEKGLKLAPLGEQKVHDKPCIGVRVSSKGRRDVSLYIDKETHMVVKAEHQIKDFQEGVKEYNQEYFMSDFKEIDGIKEAAKMVVHRDGKAYLEVEVTDFKHLESLDDTLFQKP